jgi:hypothetical protein
MVPTAKIFHLREISPLHLILKYAPYFARVFLCSSSSATRSAARQQVSTPLPEPSLGAHMKNLPVAVLVDGNLLFVARQMKLLMDSITKACAEL